MVNPLYIIAAFLAAAFAIPLVDKLHRKLSLTVFFGVLTYVLAITGMRLWGVILSPELDKQVFTAGFAAPWSIALAFGVKEAVLLLMTNLVGILSGIYLIKKLSVDIIQPWVLLMLILVGANGLILTRDIFNSFVFLEILSITTFSFIGIKQSQTALSAGFKYMMAGGVASSLLLIGIIFAYRYTGTLNLDTWIAASIAMTPGYKMALYLIMMAVIIELKPFPANGWALDVYEAAHPGVGALISTVNTGALLYLFYKLLPILPAEMLTLLSGIGLVSFFFSNLTALKQKSSTRLLGYSSTAQTGLVIFVLTGLTAFQIPAGQVLAIAAGLFITNFFAKSGIFWLTGVIKDKAIKSYAVMAENPGLVMLLGVLLLSLTGLPPFPAFYAKWDLVSILVTNQAWVVLSIILLGSLLEAGYLLNWFGQAAKADPKVKTELSLSISSLVPPAVAVMFLLTASYYSGNLFYGVNIGYFFPLFGLMLFGVLDFLPIKAKGLLAIAGLGFWGWFYILPQLTWLSMLFALILVGGAIMQILAFMRYEGTKTGMMPLIVMMIISMGNLLLGFGSMEFFFSWEMMTISSYLLILRGRQAQKPAYNYIMFSLGGAYLILTGIILMRSLYSGMNLASEMAWTGLGLLSAILMGIGFLVKLGALGVHTWLPESYTEAEDEVTSLLSSVLSKAGVFGLLVVLILVKDILVGQDLITGALGWIGALTAFFGALMAVFQEDVKKLLAYSSMSQLGYIVMGLALMSHLGWVSALYLTVNHFLFKALIFLAIAGVIMRTGTRNMYEMGGLIKKMPISYISVLMGIIAVSGVPPLSGFGSKWFIYTSLLEQGHYLQAGLAFFSSAVAFLYLYKLIHTVFLGQAKPNQSQVKEAPLWLIIPQGVLIMAIMAISMLPNLLTKPISVIVGDYIVKPDWLTWQGYNITLASPVLHGNWNGNLIMLVTMGVFMFPLIWLLLVNAKTQKVKQFNIVFAAERPYKPWTTHFAHNMFAPYNKALGFLVKPKVTAFWAGVSEGAHSISTALSQIYTGNGQTYLLHIFLYLIVVFLISGVH